MCVSRDKHLRSAECLLQLFVVGTEFGELLGDSHVEIRRIRPFGQWSDPNFGGSQSKKQK